MKSKLSEEDFTRIKAEFTYRELMREDTRLRYNIFCPQVEEGKVYPLVIYLHGAGERGQDTELAILNSGAVNFAEDAWQQAHPCFIAAPQCRENRTWNMEEEQDLITALRETLIKQYPIDPCRVYITGLSMGGLGTWSAISGHPELYAAAMPVCGAGDPEAMKNAAGVPVWAFHAADDPVVAASGMCSGLNSVGTNWGTGTLIEALKKAGGADVRYTEYPKGFMEEQYGLHPHSSWVPAYDDQEAKEWLFAQSRAKREGTV